MRIIAGEFRSRLIQSPEGTDTTRPMPDRVRESIFSLLRGHTEGQNVVDAFAGTGSIGLEAISRGAARCLFIERDREVGQILRSNVELLGAEDRADVVVGDALGASSVARCPRPAHLVFFDPPFPMLLDPASRRRVFEQFGRFIQLLDDEGYAILRTPWPFLEPVEKPLGFRRAEHIDPDTPVDETVEDVQADDWAESGPEGALEVGDASSAEGAPALPPAGARHIPLEIPGAIGPETHIYGSSGVHLYMKERSAAGG